MTGTDRDGPPLEPVKETEDLVANNPEVLGVVQVDAHTLLVRDGGWLGLLITQMKEGSGQASSAGRSQ